MFHRSKAARRACDKFSSIGRARWPIENVCAPREQLASERDRSVCFARKLTDGAFDSRRGSCAQLLRAWALTFARRGKANVAGAHDNHSAPPKTARRQFGSSGRSGSPRSCATLHFGLQVQVLLLLLLRERTGELLLLRGEATCAPLLLFAPFLT